MLALVATTTAYHGGRLTVTHTHLCRPPSCIYASASSHFDSLVRSNKVGEAVSLLLEGEEASREQAVALLDAACSSSTTIPPPSVMEEGVAAVNAFQQKQQDALKDVYDALSVKGGLRGFGSVSSPALLPLSVKELSTDDQLRLTGLPVTAFAPPQGNSPADLLAGGVTALALSALSSVLDLDLRIVVGAAGVSLLTDRLVLGGAILETFTRTARPKYATTVREHEAGHFLAAYLLGCPIEACVLDVWRAATDGRLSGAAGTVFFDPELGRAMGDGTLTRSTIDRYSVIVMAGIAAEAAQNGKAEGGQSDEAALINLLASLDGGKSWDLPRVRNQARWGASQALLLLREHGAAYINLCEALKAGEGVGGCVLAIERGLDEGFGRNGELPAQTRAREVASRATETAAVSAAATPAPLDVAVIDERQRQIAARLEEIRARLEREEETWS